MGVDLDRLWDFDRPDVTESRFRTELSTADGESALILRTQLARALGLQRRFDEAAAELDAVDEAGPPAATDAVRVHAALERGRVLRSSGRADAARGPFLAALEQAEAGELDDLAADAAHMMALVGTGEEQITWAERAITIATRSTDPRARRWVGSIANNLGWTLHGLGRHVDAQRKFELALAEREGHGDPEKVRIARWTVARGLRELGRTEEALAIQRELEASGIPDGYVEEELGELLLALGRANAARVHFGRAHAMLSADEWLAESEPDRLARLGALGAG